MPDIQFSHSQQQFTTEHTIHQQMAHCTKIPTETCNILRTDYLMPQSMNEKGNLSLSSKYGLNSLLICNHAVKEHTVLFP